MNLTTTFNGNFDEINTEQVIISTKDIYRKVNNLDNSYNIFYLTIKNDRFVWEKSLSHVIPYGSPLEDINILSVLFDKNNYKFILFKTNGFKIVTHKIQINNEGVYGEWEKVTPETNSNLMNQYIFSTQLKDIPTHLDLTKEYLCPDDPYDILNEYEPLNGWENFESPSYDDENIPSDISVEMETSEPYERSEQVPLEDIYEGSQKTVKIKRFEKCKSCSGSGAEGEAKPDTCSSCQGSGEIRQVQRSFLGQVVNVQPCHRCSGKGTIISNPCKTSISCPSTSIFM